MVTLMNSHQLILIPPFRMICIHINVASVPIGRRGITTMVTLMNSHHLILMPPFRMICIHINVASVPIGRSNAPISLPITFAKYATFNVYTSKSIWVKVNVPIINAGWLLKILDKKDISVPINTLAISKLPVTNGFIN